MPDHEPAKLDARLVDGYCRGCDKNVITGAQEYDHDHPEHYDGISEYCCFSCGRREGRWTGAVLTKGASEPRLGVEREVCIEDNQFGQRL